MKVLADGTRVYDGGARYRPVDPSARKIGVNRPANPLAQRFHGRWFEPLELVDDELREWPETRPDTDAFEHMSISLTCNCQVCQRPEAERWRRRWRREHGLRA